MLRFKSLPKDFTFDEVQSLLLSLGFELDNKGKTSGSRVEFKKDGILPIKLHKPHPNNIMKAYAMKQLYEFLINENLI
ncbi:MAG: type II toxin-antitoxin system HicA family toxin [Bacteroidales bacterium]|nr:type II toxin-antitoxin system HicA family toxin [Bacteroidales bacterium]